MESEFITYRRFNDIFLAEDLADQLESHSITYTIDEEVQAFDPTFSYTNTKEYAVKIRPTDFEKVNELLNKAEAVHIEQVSEDYYLFKFTDDELMEVIYKADEWNPFDVQLSMELLAKRGKVIDDGGLKKLRERRLAELKKTEPSQSSWIIVGYIFAILGGVMGFFIGWHLHTYKKTMPDGELFFAYNEHDRAQGRIIFYLSFLGLGIAFLYKLLPAFSNN